MSEARKIEIIGAGANELSLSTSFESPSEQPAKQIAGSVHRQTSGNQSISNHPPTRQENWKRCLDQVIHIQGDTREAGVASNWLHDIRRILNTSTSSSSTVSFNYRTWMISGAGFCSAPLSVTSILQS